MHECDRWTRCNDGCDSHVFYPVCRFVCARTKRSRLHLFVLGHSKVCGMLIPACAEAGAAAS